MNGFVLASVLFFVFLLCLVFALGEGWLGFLGRKLTFGPRRFMPLEFRRQTAPRNHSIHESVERRSLFEKGRPLRTLKLLFGSIWLFVMATLFMLAQWIGRTIFVLIVSATILLYIVYVRAASKRFKAMIATTSCPQCGQGPMCYQKPQDEKDTHHLLVCDKCHIEWDVGSV